jgi:MoCo/4Fe-4S cofactor protein with predicted Tat translocation signal
MSPIKTLKNYWKSFSELNDTEDYKKYLHKEFQDDASVLEKKEDRRDFIKFLGATTALAGLTGCSVRRPKQFIKPYAKMPEYIIPGKSLYYATTFALDEDVLGVLAESYEGRPTKIEGNPLHSSSLGAANAIHQASVLGLYDPDRQMHVVGDSESKSVEQFEGWLKSLGKDLRKTKGKGFSLLTETNVSPTFHRLLKKFKKQYPLSELHRYSPVNRDNQTQGLFSLFSDYVTPQFNYDKADVIVSLDCDFLGVEPGQVLSTKQFSSRRDPEEGKLNRLYSFENSYSLTGAKADHRYRLKSSDIPAVLAYIALNVFENKKFSIPKKLKIQLAKSSKLAVKNFSEHTLKEISVDVINNGKKSLLVAGQGQAKGVHSIVALVNEALGAVDSTVVYHKLPFYTSKIVIEDNVSSINSLVSSMKRGRVDSLLILGGNPVYNAPSDLGFENALSKVATKIHLTERENDTSELCDWVVPKSHFLESWGDQVALNGETSLVQPLIHPMGDSYSSSELLSLLSGGSKNGYVLVRNTWRSSSSDFNRDWESWLHNGVINNASTVVSASAKGSSAVMSEMLNVFSGTLFNKQIEVVFKPDYSVYDGRFVNNGWLQESPDPITKLTWDNAALISRKTASTLQLKNEDLVRISTRHGEVESPIFILPGHADNSLTLNLGYGQKMAGRVGETTGFDTFSIRTSTEMDALKSITVIKQNKTYPLASTQIHGSLEGRPIYRETTELDYKKHPNFAKEMVETPPLKSLYDEFSYDKGYQWGLAIDLSKCTGCNACVVGCQSENNIPIVGKDQVLNGREMHWIRIDRYFEGDPDNPSVVEQPMTCLQCEMAPCEQVCPVAATTHSNEGLNDMVYNRCVGTRYCSDNCPTKVRRFNFFDYHQRNPQSQPKEREHLFDYMREPDTSIQKQFNPDVTVRMRGIMEKCTYCVQRISKAKIHSKNEGRLVKDGEIKTACQQTCPADAIVFGDILDPKSKVSIMKNKNRDYHILEQLHLKARTSFLASIKNPNPKLVAEKVEVSSHHG